jgi:thioredoxin-like negative regulator of GroEL
MAKPVVDGLERKMEGKMKVARIDVGEDEGRAIAAKYGIGTVPAFVLVAPNGEVLYQKVGGKPDVDAVAAKVDALRQPH